MSLVPNLRNVMQNVFGPSLRSVVQSNAAAVQVGARRTGSLLLRRLLATEAAPIEKVQVTVNGKQIVANKHSTILEVCRRNNIYIPTLCNHPRLPIKGTCRLCLVEIEGRPNLVPSCYQEVMDGMVVHTNTQKVNESVKGVLNLILANHPNACMTCEANGRCELQDLAYRYHGGDWAPEPRKFTHEWDDATSPAIFRDLDKCVRCGRCVLACNEIQGMNVIGMAERGGKELPFTLDKMELGSTMCVECGQCAAYCPVGAIVERSEIPEVMEVLESEKIKIIQTAPAVRVAIGEELGMAPGTISTGQMVTALKQLGFDYVFDTDFAADLTIMEEGTELLERVKNGGPFPMFTSCCPAWVQLVEKAYPEYIPNLSSCKSPQQMMGAMLKNYWAQKIGVKPEQISVISIMPCTAKKHEAERPEFATTGKPDVDYVLTTRELGKLLRMRKVPMASLPETEYDDPLGKSTGAAILFGATGGVMEAALRTAYEVATGQPLPKLDFDDVRGLKGVKEATVQVGDLPLKVAVAHGTARAKHLLEMIKNKEVDYQFVEIMSCPGGCIGGGGQPKSLDPDILNKRINAIYNIDERMVIRKSHENPSIATVYSEYLEKPLGHKSHQLLHTHYTDKSANCN